MKYYIKTHAYFYCLLIALLSAGWTWMNWEIYVSVILIEVLIGVAVHAKTDRKTAALKSELELLKSELKAHRDSYYAQWSKSTRSPYTWSTTCRTPEFKESHTEIPRSSRSE